MKNVLKPLAKSILIPLGLRVVASATEAAIHKKIFESGTTTLIILNEEINDIVKIIKNEAKGQRGGFLNMLLGTIGAILLGNYAALSFN